MSCGSYVVESDVAAVGVIRGVWMGRVHRRRVVDVDNEGGGVGGGCQRVYVACGL